MQACGRCAPQHASLRRTGPCRACPAGRRGRSRRPRCRRASPRMASWPWPATRPALCAPPPTWPTSRRSGCTPPASSSPAPHMRPRCVAIVRYTLMLMLLAAAAADAAGDARAAGFTGAQSCSCSRLRRDSRSWLPSSLADHGLKCLDVFSPFAQDLDPYKTSPTAAAGSLEGADDVVSRATEVGRYADYKNAPLLASFLSGGCESLAQWPQLMTTVAGVLSASLLASLLPGGPDWAQTVARLFVAAGVWNAPWLVAPRSHVACR